MSSGAYQRRLCSMCASRAALESLQEHVPVGNGSTTCHCTCSSMSASSRYIEVALAWVISSVRAAPVWKVFWHLPVPPLLAPLQLVLVDGCTLDRGGGRQVQLALICPQGLEHLCIRLARPLPASALEVVFVECLCRHVLALAASLHPSSRPALLHKLCLAGAQGTTDSCMTQAALAGSHARTCSMHRQRCSQYEVQSHACKAASCTGRPGHTGRTRETRACPPSSCMESGRTTLIHGCPSWQRPSQGH